MRKFIDILLISLCFVIVTLTSLYFAKAGAEESTFHGAENSELQSILVVGEDFDQVLGLKNSAVDFMHDLLLKSIYDSPTINYLIFQKDFFANTSQEHFDNYLHAKIYGEELYDEEGNTIDDKTFLSDVLNFKYREQIKYYYPLLMNQELFASHEINLQEYLSGVAASLFRDKPLFALLVARYLRGVL